MYYEKMILQLDLCKMDYCITSKPSADEKSGNNNKHLFRNNLPILFPIPKTHKVPDNISTLIVYVMNAVRMISVADLKPRTFKSWADAIMNYVSLMSGNNLHAIFDNQLQLWVQCSVQTVTRVT